MEANLMKRHALSAGFVATLSCILLSAAPPATADGGSTVRVNVGKLRNTKGHLACGLFSKPEGFPKKMTAGAASALQWLPITGDVVRCEFKGLGPGTYAIAVFHDENDNRSFDTNFLGVPEEGHGSTNNVKHAMSAPTFDDAKFELRTGTDSNSACRSTTEEPRMRRSASDFATNSCSAICTALRAAPLATRAGDSRRTRHSGPLGGGPQ